MVFKENLGKGCSNLKEGHITSRSGVSGVKVLEGDPNQCSCNGLGGYLGISGGGREL